MLTSVVIEDFAKQLVSAIILGIHNKDLTGKGPSNASGDLAKSIRYEVKGNTIEVYGLDYIYFLEYGRKPGKRPPTSVIEKWIDDKGIETQGITKKSLAFLIARSIGEKGTLIYQHTQGESSGLLSGVINDQTIADLNQKLAFAYADQITSDIMKSLPSTMKKAS